MKIRIKVTKEILKRSMMCGTDQLENSKAVSEGCAIALACQEIFPNCHVGGRYIKDKPYYSTANWKIKMPREAIEFINSFDRLYNTPKRRLELPELEFEIELTDETFDSLDINIDEAIEIINNSKTLAL